MWIYNNNREIQYIKSIQDTPEGVIGFVYQITNMENNKSYIGKKSLHSTVSKKLTKREISEQTGPGRKATKRKVTTESNWLTYTGSCKLLNEDIKQLGRDKFIFKILKWCYNKKQLSFWETHYQFTFQVLIHQEHWYNESILGKYYASDV